MKTSSIVVLLIMIFIGGVLPQGFQQIDRQIIDLAFNGDYLRADSLLEEATSHINTDPQPKHLPNLGNNPFEFSIWIQFDLIYLNDLKGYSWRELLLKSM